MKPAGFDDPDFRKLLKDAADTTHHRRNCLRKAVRDNDVEGAQMHTAWLLTDSQPKLLAAAVVACSGKVRPNPSAADCLLLPQSLKLMQLQPEIVPLRLRKKSNGNHRIIANFGFAHRTAQRVLKSILSAYHRPQSYQYTHRGPGRAILRARKLITTGKLWFAHLDIKEFYSSFKIEKLLEDAALGGILPSKTVASFVSARNLEFDVRQSDLGLFPHLTYSDLLWQARRGIPTGSSVSSIVAVMMVSRLKLTTAVKTSIINFEDDFLVLASSKEELAQTVEALRLSVGKLPGGHFSLIGKSQGCFENDSLVCLGHSIALVDGKLVVSVSGHNTDQFYAMLLDFENSAGEFAHGAGKLTPEKRLIQCAKLSNYLRSWHGTFTHSCDDASNIFFHGWCFLIEALNEIGKKSADLKHISASNPFVFSTHFEISGTYQ